MSKKSKKAPAELSFSGALSATKRRHFRHIHSGAMSAIVKIQQAVCQSFPEYGRPHICRITYLCLGNDR